MKYTPSNKILICIPFWAGDRQQAMKLARLIADIEPTHNATADFLFLARFDCDHDKDTLKYVARKFHTHSYVSKRRGTGWPLGCNSVFFGLVEWFYHKMSAGQIPGYKAVFIAESDGAPLRNDWILQLHREWSMASSEKKICMAGALIPHDVNPHINGGCCLMTGDLEFLKWLIRIQDIRVPAGWDWILASKFKDWGWSDIPGIKSFWRRPTFTKEDWCRENIDETIWYHGLKDDSLLDLARKNLLTPNGQ